MEEKKWFVYLLECKDGSLYTGASNDVEKRMEKHRLGRGSKYVASKGFGRLVGTKECGSKSDAMKEEYRIKQLDRLGKLEFFRGN